MPHILRKRLITGSAKTCLLPGITLGRQPSIVKNKYKWLYGMVGVQACRQTQTSNQKNNGSISPRALNRSGHNNKKSSNLWRNSMAARRHSLYRWFFARLVGSGSWFITRGLHAGGRFAGSPPPSYGLPRRWYIFSNRSRLHLALLSSIVAASRFGLPLLLILCTGPLGRR